MTQHSTQTSKPNTDDLRIKEIKELVPPAHVFREYPVSTRAAQTTYAARPFTASCMAPTTACSSSSAPARSTTMTWPSITPRSWPRKPRNTPKTSSSSCASISKSRARRSAGKG
jgi:hypothetical protein